MTDAAPETAYLTADAVLFADGEHDDLHVLVIRRGWDPFVGCLALPGGHVDPGEDTAAAARRELAEETGLVVSPAALELVGVYAAPNRDPRGRYATFVYTARLSDLPAATAGDDATDARWVPVAELLADETGIAFDHAQIIRDALRSALDRDAATAR